MQTRNSNLARFFQVFVVRRERWTLTWAGLLVLLAALTIVVLAGVQNLYSFLTVSSPVRGRFLVVEGWLPAYAYREAAAEFSKGGYESAIAAGVMHENGNAGGDRDEDFGAGKLIYYGVPAGLVATASNHAVQRDRTFHAAIAVKEWLARHDVGKTSIDIVTVGAHARRSRLLYQEALGDDVKVGVISVDDQAIDPRHWWRTSEGARTVITETVGYVYVRLFYSPERYLTPVTGADR